MGTRYRIPASGPFVADQNGKVVVGATVTVYVWTGAAWALATIYAAYTGGSAVAGSAVTTDSDGMYSVYVDSDDYPLVTSFRLVVTKANYETVTLDHIR